MKDNSLNQASEILAKENKLNEIYAELESERKFNDDINPIDWSEAKPVDINFPYIPKGWLKLKYALINCFIVKPFTWFQAKRVYKVKVNGRKNLKGIKSAIVTSNHIAIFDCLVNKYVLRRKTKIIGAEFNNKNGKFGEYMRVGGMLPLSKSMSIMKKLNNAIEYYLSKNQYILVYPEKSMWYMYEKPRPYMPGAFHYAASYNVPVIPMFTTFKKTGKFNKDGSPKYQFTVNIGEPIYPDVKLSRQENCAILAKTTFEYCVGVYETVYNKKLEYKSSTNTKRLKD